MRGNEVPWEGVDTHGRDDAAVTTTPGRTPHVSTWHLTQRRAVDLRRVASALCRTSPCPCAH
ncbi:putative leader peptide [Cellulomonas sp. NPDC057328]|uniref:putative leader peptide n=1 Tax=Cellulomonas sp. NPDC057328 TaxID=3346101 RepID=UPI00363AE155